MGNPNNANQYVADPRQQLFLANYLNMESPTWSNALQSALKAGYSQEYAENITAQMPTWLLESLGNNKRLQKAERVLDKTLEMDAVDQEGKLDNQLLKTQTDVAKFVASTVGKRIYSTRTEHTGENGGAITIKSVNYGGDNPTV